MSAGVHVLQVTTEQKAVSMKERILTLNNQLLVCNAEQSMRCLLHDVREG